MPARLETLGYIESARISVVVDLYVIVQVQGSFKSYPIALHPKRLNYSRKEVLSL